MQSVHSVSIPRYNLHYEVSLFLGAGYSSRRLQFLHLFFHESMNTLHSFLHEVDKLFMQLNIFFCKRFSVDTQFFFGLGILFSILCFGILLPISASYSLFRHSTLYFGILLSISALQRCFFESCLVRIGFLSIEASSLIVKQAFRFSKDVWSSNISSFGRRLNISFLVLPHSTLTSL